jgi:hypothetical protein
LPGVPLSDEVWDEGYEMKPQKFLFYRKILINTTPARQRDKNRLAEGKGKWYIMRKRPPFVGEK